MDYKRIKDICLKKAKEGRVYRVSDCVIRGPRKSRFINSNHTKTVDCVIYGKECTTLKKCF